MEVKFDFLEKESELEMYGKVREMLIKNGYKPLNNITITFSLDYKQTNSPYTLSIKQKIKPNKQKIKYNIAA